MFSGSEGWFVSDFDSNGGLYQGIRDDQERDLSLSRVDELLKVDSENEGWRCSLEELGEGMDCLGCSGSLPQNNQGCDDDEAGGSSSESICLIKEAS